jgi:dTDP-4-dehydrorhamnose 3,5-epimerase
MGVGKRAEIVTHRWQVRPVRGPVMEISDTAISGIKLLKPIQHVDARGALSEVFRKDLMSAGGMEFDPVQENHILSTKPGTIRGLHFQVPPFAQAKLVRVTAGTIFDVAVDIRWGSPTYGRHIAVLISAAEGNQIFIPEGFAHGFCTINSNTEVSYKVNNYRSADHERGLLWNDAALGIRWPVSTETTIASHRDSRQPLLADLPQIFA